MPNFLDFNASTKKYKFIGFQKGSGNICQGNFDHIVEQFKQVRFLKAKPSLTDDFKEQEVTAAPQDGALSQPAAAVAGEPRELTEKKAKEKETKSKENASLLWFGGIAIAAMVFFGFQR